MIAKTKEIKHVHHRRRIIFLKPGETAVRSCSRFPVRTIDRVIREGEALVVICRRTGRRFVFVCGVALRVKVVVLPRRTRIRVSCII